MGVIHDHVSIAVVVNTCALGIRASGVRSSGGVRHGERHTLLQHQILPRLREADEVVVVGEYCPGDGYTYVPSPSRLFNCADALKQRHDGLQHTSSGIVVFMHDDHLPDESFFSTLREYDAFDDWDVLVPQRVCDVPNGNSVTLNNGRAQGYIMGHAAAYRRTLFDRVSWLDVPEVFVWDTHHTAQVKQAGGRVHWVNDLVVHDLEPQLGAQPWL